MVGRPLWERKVPGSSPGAPIFISFMNSAEPKLPYLTFVHRPQRGYLFHGDGDIHTVVSPAFETPVDFSSLILSVNYHTATNGWLLSEVQIRQGGVWSKFFKLALFSVRLGHSFDTQEDDSAFLAVDVLRAKTPAQAYRFRLTLHGDMDVPRVFVCLTDAAAAYDGCAAILPPGHLKIPVNPLSQMCLAVSPTDKLRLCSPTSLTMALQSLGVKAEPLQTASAVYDDRARIYGNWTLNTAYASRLGCEAFVTRFQRLSQLGEFLTPQSLVLATVAYKRGELAGAAAMQTPGHLVLLCGWENGKIRVADPAAETAKEVIRFYDAAEFARAWLMHKRGAAYLVRKL